MRFQGLVVIIAFLLAAGWYFFPIWEPSSNYLLFTMRLALPATLLALGGIGLVPTLMTFGFVFCAIGDAMGVIGSFEGQMAAFAMAHICFISYFVEGIRESKPQPKVLFATTLLCLVPIVLAALKVIPQIHELPIQIGCCVYALLLTGTLWTSIVRAFSINDRKLLPYVAALGALLFLVSDFTLSWNRFTARIPHASLYILTTYYAALLLLFVGTLKKES